MLLLGILIIVLLISISTAESKKSKLYKPLYLNIVNKGENNKNIEIRQKHEDTNSLSPLIFSEQGEDLKLSDKKISKYQLFDYITSKNTTNESIKYIVLVLVFSLIISTEYYSEYFSLINDNYYIYNGLFNVNSITQLFEVTLLLFAVLILFSFNSIKFANTNKNGVALVDSYGLIGSYSILGGLLLIDTNNLLLLFISIELQSYALYILSSIYKNSFSSTDSGLKYFLLGGLASVFILFGSGLIYVSIGSIDLDSLYLLINLGYYDNLIIGGTIFIILGLLLKAASAPMHSWSPDVYDGVPTLVTTWLSVLTKISILGFLSKFIKNIIINSNFNLNFEDLFSTLSNVTFDADLILVVVLICASLSMLIGSISGLKEVNLKRLLAFSGVTNIGYLLLALTNTSNSNSLIFYLIQYSITNLNLFLIILLLGFGISSPYSPYYYKLWKLDVDIYSPIRYTSQLTGLFYSYPYLGISLAISLFSLVGIPPLAGFYGKYFILIDSINSHYYFMVIILIFSSVISSFYYLRLIKIIFTPVNKISDLVHEAPDCLFSNLVISRELDSNLKSQDGENSDINYLIDYNNPNFIDYSNNYLIDYNNPNFIDDSNNYSQSHFDNDFYNKYFLNNISTQLNNIVSLDVSNPEFESYISRTGGGGNLHNYNHNFSNKLFSFDPICLVVSLNTCLLISFFLFSDDILNFLL